MDGKWNQLVGYQGAGVLLATFTSPWAYGFPGDVYLGLVRSGPIAQNSDRRDAELGRDHGPISSRSKIE